MFKRYQRFLLVVLLGCMPFFITLTNLTNFIFLVIIFVQCQSGKAGQQKNVDPKKAEALAKQKEERQKQKRVLESCLTLVRSLYTSEEVRRKIQKLNLLQYRKKFKTLSWLIPLRTRNV